MLYSSTMDKPKIFCLALAVALLAACSKEDASHTTVVTQVPPPPQQVLKVIHKPVPETRDLGSADPTADPRKPLLVFHFDQGQTFRVGEEVPIAFTVSNAKLKSDGGEFRVRYIVDDDDMQWLDSTDSFWLAGWIPGKHTIRIELIGPDGWPYKNGNSNIVTKEISINPN